MATIVANATGGNWSATSAWTGGVVPTAADDVQLNAGSGPITIDVAAFCRSLDCTGYTGTLTHGSAIQLKIGTSTPGLSNIALLFSAGMTYTPSSASSEFIFVSTSATAQNVDFQGKSLRLVTFNGVGGSWKLTSTMSVASGSTVTLTAGTLDTNGQTCSWGLFNSSNANTRTLTLGASAITITGTGVAWNIQTITGLTFNANTSTITCNGANVTFNAGSLTYNAVSLTGSGSNTVLSGVATFASFSRTGTAAKTDTLLVGNNFTVTGTLTIGGNSAINRLLIQSNTVATTRIITAATVTVTNADFQDITGAGTGSWNLAAITGNSGDCGGNSGITFTSSATQTWSGTTSGSWSTNAWTGRVPLPQDDVTISSAFAASQTVTADMPRLGRSIVWTGTTGTPNFAIATSVSIYGSLTLISGMAMTNTGNITYSGRSSYTITSAGKSHTGQIIINAPGGTYTLADDVATAFNLTVTSGAFSAATFNVSCLTFQSSGTNTRSITLGTGTWSITSTAATTVWNIITTGLTFSGANATIAITTVSTNTRTFTAGTSLIYGTLTYTVTGSTGMLSIGNSATFNTINFSDTTNARTLQFQSSTTTTVTNFNVTGTPTKLMTINSTTPGSQATLSKASGTVSSDYLSLQDSAATGGATWYAGANSTNVSNNSGWIFTAPPAVSSNTGLLLMGIG